MKKTLLFLTVALACSTAQATEKTVTLSAAGQLSSQVDASEKYAITELTVSGPMNGADFAFIRDMAGKDEEGESTEGQLQVLDLSGASIVAGGVYYTDMKSTEEYEAEANTIGDYMFRDLTLTKVSLPAGITKIGYRAFYNCTALESIVGTESATELGTGAFESCTVLDGVVLNASLTEIPTALFRRCNALDHFSLPAGITKINEEAFYGCKLSNLTLPEGLEIIGKGALSGIEATTLTLPSTVKVLEANAIYDCSNLAEIILNEGLVEIGEGALGYNRALTNLTIPSTVTTIGESAFNHCKLLTEMALPEGITTIPAYCFDQCAALKSVGIPSTVTTIGECAFQMCSELSDIVLPEGLETIEANAFSSCEALMAIELPTTLRTIGDNAFESSGLTEVNIPEGVTRLGSEGGMWMPGGSVFAWCTNLKKVTLPSTIESLGAMTFDSCPLEELTIKAVTPPNIEGFLNNPFGFDDSIYEQCTVIVPEEALDAYKEDAGWSQFMNIIADTATGIATVSQQASRQSTTAYTIGGQRAGSHAKGIIIENGRKMVK